MTENRVLLTRLGFVFILALYIMVASLFATQTPAWQAPDEPAHYNYVLQVASEGCCPVIEQGDWDSSTLSELTSNQFAPDLLGVLPTIQYEDHQPPLYYLLASLVFRLTDGSLIALRLFSVLLGAITVTLTYFIGREVLPEQPQLALAGMAVVAFLPQHMAILASVNNDALAEVVIALTLYLSLRYLRDTHVPVWWLGLAVGIGVITKTTTYFLLAIVVLVVVLRWRRDRTPNLIRVLIGLMIPMSIFALVWFLRNIQVYGFPDFLGLGAHDLVVADQPRTADWIAELGIGAYLSQGLQTSFNSFWGQFGWMALPMEPRIYTFLGGLMLVGTIGGVYRIWSQRVSNAANALQRERWLLLWATLILAVAAFVYYNTEFVQFQGRYLFPGLIAFAFILVVGIDSTREAIIGRWSWSIWVTPILLLVLPLIDVYMLYRYIIPVLSP